jgi:CRP-like cAMP-binding protein
MLSSVSERRMHYVRWVLTVAWLAILASLFYDPWSAALTQPDHPWSPLRLDLATCVRVQGVCLVEQPYPLGTTIFWGAVVPSAIFILLVFGHELWRRICPLSFLSQIPRALGRQRQFKRENPQTGKVRYELAKVKPDSWLGRNYPYVQFGWLFVGLCGRILFFNADRLVLAGWLLFSIAAAITVGYFYGGKTWCNYFCPMAPVQRVYGEPGGLLTSKAHTDTRTITQSMCRTVQPDGSEQSACVACQNPCIDIDAERSYWDGLQRPEQPLIYYGYVGLVVGYFVYYYLYAGDWSYYFSGAWARQPDQLSELLKPGFYLLGQAIAIPKLVAVPLTLGVFTAVGYASGRWLENRAMAYQAKHPPKHRATISRDRIRHRLFTLCTYVIFNFFFIFGGRPLVRLLPYWVQYSYDLGLVLLSTLWVYQTWHKTPELYAREGLANRFRKQLEKLDLNVGQFLEGKTVNDLNIDEVYVLAKVLPGFTKEKRHQAYKGVVREALEEGYANYSSSLEVLKQMRLELNLSDDEHRQVLEELGVENPELLDPNRQRSLENSVRLNGYRKAVERLIGLQQRQTSREGFNQLVEAQSTQLSDLRRQYSIAPQEEDWILSGLEPETGDVRRSHYLIQQLAGLIRSYRTVNQPVLKQHSAALSALQASLHHKMQLIVQTVLETLELLQDDAAAQQIAQDLGALSSQTLLETLESGHWRDRLPSQVYQRLHEPGAQPLACPVDQPVAEIVAQFEQLLGDRNPLIQMVCLYLIAQLDGEHSRTLAQTMQASDSHPALRQLASQLLQAPPPAPPLAHFPTLEKAVYLFNSDFFHRMHTETLLALGDRAEIRTYQAGNHITEEGDTCRELLLLVQGDAQARFHLKTGEWRTRELHPGQTLDELEILAHSNYQGTVVAQTPDTRILAIPVDAFDDWLDQDPDFARRVLELESRQLQHFIHALQPAASGGARGE